MPKKKKTEVSDDPELILSAIEEIGAECLTDLGELAAEKYIDTGIWGLNYVLSHGGIPSTYVVEVHGGNGLGKSSLALHLAAQANKQGFNVYYVDVEMAVNDAMASIFLGKDDAKWIRPDSGEKALDIIKLILKSTKNSFVVLDSVGATTPIKIEDASSEDQFIGSHAKMMSNFGAPAARNCKRNNNVLLCLNHESANITPMGARGYVVSGGKKWSYVPDLRIRLTKKFQNGDITEGDTKIGHVVEAEVTKNRHGPPFMKVDLPLIYGKGFDTNRDLVENAIAFGIIKKAGAWYSYGEDKHQGLLSISQWLEKYAEKRESIIKELNEVIYG